MAPPTIIDRVEAAGYPYLSRYTSDELLKLAYPNETRTFKEITNNKERQEVQKAMRNKQHLMYIKNTQDVLAWNKAHPQLASEYEAYCKRVCPTCFD